MTNVKKLGLAAVVIIAVLGCFFPRGNSVVQQVQNQVLGNVTSLDGVDNAYVRINGNGYYNYRQNMVATSSVLCSIKNPYQATSTLVDYVAQVTSGSLVQAQTLDVATSSTALASSSPAFVKEFSLAAGAQASLYWTQAAATTTNARLIGSDFVNGVSNAIVGPSEFVNLRIATATPGTFSSYLTGTCRGTFRSFRD